MHRLAWRSDDVRMMESSRKIETQDAIQDLFADSWMTSNRGAWLPTTCKTSLTIPLPLSSRPVLACWIRLVSQNSHKSPVLYQAVWPFLREWLWPHFRRCSCVECLWIDITLIERWFSVAGRCVITDFFAVSWRHWREAALDSCLCSH